ncbi:GH36-type glycosyl hydrolase domain-containing protein [Kinneretia aquatilis]|uniref:GH36-type glycosyl hydrolase domain-containing protein n=1 Tax=Kinneretia aquatilis TaxID=2070761 RepID=UPI001FAF2B14|nr:glucoamylase family protein [Paucibacter aquatile]
MELLHALLDPRQGRMLAPIRAEIFGQQRFAQHGRSLAATHRVRAAREQRRGQTFVPRLRSNIDSLRQAHRFLARQASTGFDISPAAEWLLDNFHLIEAQLQEVQQGLPRRYFRALPVLSEEPLAGLPRVYGVAWACIAHTDGAFDEDLLVHFLCAYQGVRPLNLGEIWALPTTLRVVLIENLRRLAERVAGQKAARELANQACDRMAELDVATLEAQRAALQQRGLDQPFLAQMAQRLLHRAEPLDAAAPLASQARRAWLLQALPDPAAAQLQQAAEQTADNLSVSNAVHSLRVIGEADWPEIIARSSPLMQLLLGCESFAAEHSRTRDQTLHAIEALARRCGRSELGVAQLLLDVMRCPRAGVVLPAAHTQTCGHWLQGEGRPALLQALGLRESPGLALRAVLRRRALPLYLGSLGLATAAVLAMFWWLEPSLAAAPWPALLACAALMLLPASEACLALMNRLLSESLRPAELPRLALADGIPPAQRVLVVMPVLLSDAATIAALAHRLHLHQLANPEPQAQFALLSDWADADQASSEGDEALLGAAVAALGALNRAAPVAPEAPARFLLLHRPRRFSDSEQRWMGWERKRGKLEQLVEHLACPGEAVSPFVELGRLSQPAPGIHHLLTLDSDTQMPPGRLRELVGVAAHPRNEPRLSEAGPTPEQPRRVLAGYAILQPRVVTPLPARSDFTPYHWLFAGQCGIDPYGSASSETYQDLFDEGSFSGKGLLHVQALQAVLNGRLPEGQVLSHDLLEGALARCAAVSDISLVEDAPFHAEVAASRLHRWIRGDWQLLPFLLPALMPQRWSRQALRLGGLNRWKLADNLRRSLVAPASLLLLLLALGLPAGLWLAPGAALALVLAAHLAGPLLGALAGLLPSRSGIALGHFLREGGAELARALLASLWQLALLLEQSALALDAIVRALWRSGHSHRLLLQWTTAAAAQAALLHSGTHWTAIWARHRRVTVAGLLLAAGLSLAPASAPRLALGLCLLWAASPLWLAWASRPGWLQAGRRSQRMDGAEQRYLRGIARDTWRFFERCVGPQDRQLPPDNLQLLPQEMVAHRSSPTNIGLYLLSVACARQFGWIGSEELMRRLSATLDSLAALERHRGHWLNWYDTETGTALLPRYVSTVDSGNLCGHLLAVAQACRSLALAPWASGPAEAALEDSRQRLQPLQVLWPLASEGREPSWPRLRELIELPAPLAQARADVAGFELLLEQAASELAQRRARSTGAHEAPLELSSDPREQLNWLLLDHLNLLRSALEDIQAQAEGRTATASPQLLALAQRCEALAAEPDFGFLYHPKRHLLHIGFRVAEQELDAGFYDLLASESRLTSLLAMAKGDVPVRHWAALGRPFFASGLAAGLRSWSGSMFEYLMPSLMLDEPVGSALRGACRAAIAEQRAFGARTGLPWGISESAYAGRDHSLAYQYAPQGVPRLALRRTPPEELVIAPYATALAAQLEPRLACRNFALLEELSARGRYGFIEALDFSPARQGQEQGPGLPERRLAGCVPVVTFMAHHQGMSIAALANVLLDGQVQRWGMAYAPLEAVASLLHERAPRELPRLSLPVALLPAPVFERRVSGLLREVDPGEAAIEPSQLLSNGRYHLSLRPNGAGASQLGSSGLSRQRDDALRDEYGSFLFLRGLDPAEPQRLVSLTQHPAPDARADYRCSFHPDRVCLSAHWPGLSSQLTVWVSPEDDIEFRQVELHNLGDRPLELELISAFEPTLAEAGADEAHPAFSNLFLRAQWQAAQQALLLQRKPRLPGEPELLLAHFLTELCPENPAAESGLHGLALQTDRQLWRGRLQPACRPRGQLRAVPTGQEAVVLDTGLDPVCVLAARLRIPAQGKLMLTFATAASREAGTLHAVIDKYRQAAHVQRASLMSATLCGIRLRSLRISPANLAAVQTLSSALLLSLSRPQLQEAAGGLLDGTPGCDRSLLWRFGISGERPLIVVQAGVIEGLGLLRSLAQALILWAWAGVACDLVVINAESASYHMALQRELAALRERHLAEGAAQAQMQNTHNTQGKAAGPSRTQFHLLRAEDVSPTELGSLRALASVCLEADGRPLHHQVRVWSAAFEAACQQRQDGGAEVVALCRSAARQPADPGRFSPDGARFEFEVSARQRPERPWINVLANPSFGAQVSDSGAGYSWALNSRLHQLSAWSNDPVADTPGEWWLLQDEASQEVWSLAPSAWGEGSPAQVCHSQGWTEMRQQRGSLSWTLRWCVDADQAIKQVQLRLHNAGERSRRLRLIGLVEWLMGAQRNERMSCDSRMLQLDGGLALLCTQREGSAGFGQSTAFLTLLPMAPGTAGPEDRLDWSCDRRECFDARGRLQLPQHGGEAQGAGLDPCALLSRRWTLAAGARCEQTFLLGHAASPAAAQRLLAQAVRQPPLQRLSLVRARWDALLEASEVQTPDPLFDALVNRWLLYQTLACRLWAKAGFYQAGGATGFRDHLQDAMALAWAAPELLRAQILLHASRQFAEGDVQHWWHAPLGAGVRTHCSDDLLWLPLACLQHLRINGDAGLLDENVPFLNGVEPPELGEDRYARPGISTQRASVYEHAALSIDRSLRVGRHGLPLMGTGDWNDGMNRVGQGGQGESVWLGWLLWRLVMDFAPLAQARGQHLRAQRWLDAAQGWQQALLGTAWGGAWFTRAYFDDGQALGGQGHRPDQGPARIDLIAQAWSVLSGAAPLGLQARALASMDGLLVDSSTGLIRLLDPPLQDAAEAEAAGSDHAHNPGYIQAYPPGVRENGGQYTHAGVWALMAQAGLARQLLELAQGEPQQLAAAALQAQAARASENVYRYFRYLSPAHRASDPRQSRVYGAEPYAVAGDVYSAPPYTGRGGWSWYTGSAAWLHRAALESIFGLALDTNHFSLQPCLPLAWPQARLILRRQGRLLQITLLRGTPAQAQALAHEQAAQLLRPGQRQALARLPLEARFVLQL